MIGIFSPQSDTEKLKTFKKETISILWIDLATLKKLVIYSEAINWVFGKETVSGPFDEIIV